MLEPVIYAYTAYTHFSRQGNLCIQKCLEKLVRMMLFSRSLVLSLSFTLRCLICCLLTVSSISEK